LGLLMWQDDATGRWWSSGCSVRDPERLREAAAPLPAPDGRGPVRVLAGGSWGEVGHLALDGRGRTLGYGVGDRRVVELEACPGAGAFLELYASRDGYAVAARRLRTNALLWEQDVAIDGETPVGLGCAAGRSPGAYVATSTHLHADRASEGHVLQLGDDTRRVVYEGSLFDAAFGPRDRAFLQRDTGGSQVAELDLRSGSARFIGGTPRGAAPLAVSPDGRRLATVAGASLFVFDLATGSKTRRELRGDTFGEAGWFGERTVGYFPRCGDNRGIEVFDAALETRRRVPGRWCASDSATVGRRAWGIFAGIVRKATIRGGVRVVARFPSKNLNVLAGVPGDRSVEWPEP
ncbi:MAG TPA: hypothetical protein VG318_10800, partial [Actinomycetota bacterium]|nr:hypothetical protein [Actinomycetota bacterium]